MSPFDRMIEDVLGRDKTRGPRTPVARQLVTLIETKIAYMRRMLAEGPRTALELAEGVTEGMSSEISAGTASALLAGDLRIGRVVVDKSERPCLYRLSATFDEEDFMRQIQARDLLVRRGWKCTPPVDTGT